METPTDDSQRTMFLSTQELAELLNVPVGTVRRWRYHGDGPPAHKLGRHVRYNREAALGWIADQADAPRAS